MHKQKIFMIMERVLQLLGRGAQAEVMLLAQEGALTRFAGNRITQNVASHTVDLSIRIQEGGRIGRAGTRAVDEASIKNMIERAKELSAASRKTRGLLPLAGTRKYGALPVARGRDSLSTPEERGSAVQLILAKARHVRLEAAGIVSKDKGILALMNTRGLRAQHKFMSGRVSITMNRGGASGWAEYSNRTVALKDAGRTAERAAEKCLKSQNPRSVDPGPYTVVLEPACVGEIFQFMAWYGFGALAFQEGTSFLTGRMGKRIFSPRVTIEDNVYHPLTQGFPFDFEGVPRERVSLIERGVARGLVHDRRTARAAHTRSTGHGLAEPNEVGPLPLNLVMQKGGSRLEDMIRDTRRGILVTHFHYTNMMNPRELVLTGLTRDGTYLIERGRIARPVRNLRFTESMLKAFSNVEAVGREQVYTEGFFGGGYVAPAIKIHNFQFTSQAEEEKPL
ncbi:MAG: TldD/PmbA family protein [Candidatus Omnitrophica bacterium]|nr:TldD/PmbA family protein [Candidatus Omnitrophota bacterium]